MPQLVANVDSEVLRRVDALAKSQGRSRSNLVHWLLGEVVAGLDDHTVERRHDGLAARVPQPELIPTAQGHPESVGAVSQQTGRQASDQPALPLAPPEVGVRATAAAARDSHTSELVPYGAGGWLRG